jgi:hypothetical protein
VLPQLRQSKQRRVSSRYLSSGRGACLSAPSSCVARKQGRRVCAPRLARRHPSGAAPHLSPLGCVALAGKVVAEGARDEALGLAAVAVGPAVTPRSNHTAWRYDRWASLHAQRHAPCPLLQPQAHARTTGQDLTTAAHQPPQAARQSPNPPFTCSSPFTDSRLRTRP